MFGFRDIFSMNLNSDQSSQTQASGSQQVRPSNQSKNILTMSLPQEFYVLVEYDRDVNKMRVLKIGSDKSSPFFDFPSDCQEPIQHPHVIDHPQYKQFVAWINSNRPKTREKYVRNLKFQTLDSNKKQLPESRFYINSAGKFRMKKGTYEYLATAEPVHRQDDTSVDLNYTGQELLDKFGKKLFRTESVTVVHFSSQLAIFLLKF